MRSNRSKSISLRSFAPGSNKGSDPDAYSIRSRSSAFSKKQKAITMRLKQLQTNGEMLIQDGSLSAKARDDLRDILQENRLYEEVIDQINKRLKMQNTISNAHEVLSSSKKSSAIESLRSRLAEK